MVADDDDDDDDDECMQGGRLWYNGDSKVAAVFSPTVLGKAEIL